MGEIHFEIEGDYIVKYTGIPSMPNTYQKEIVMDKKTFLEVFEKWIPKVWSIMKYIELTQVIRTGYGNEYKPLIVNVDSIAGVTEDREGYGEVRLNDGYVYTTKECASEIIRLIEEVVK